MSKIRYLFLLGLLIGGSVVVFHLYQKKAKAPLGLSFSPAFQLLGKSTSTLDIALTRILPINEMDEKAYGDAIAQSYDLQVDPQDKNYIYLNKLIKEICVFSKKSFKYRVYIVSTSIPNAFALPGGIICVTEGLMSTMRSEAQIISVLSHEMGHVERGHCFDAIKYELAMKKIHAASIGQLADLVINVFLRHSFSKTQENDADEYGYDLLLLTEYDPAEFGNAFMQLQKAQETSTVRRGIISDYFETHPPLQLRIEKFSQMASAWWIENKGISVRYVGTRNLSDRIPLSTKAFSKEWTKGLVTH